MTEAVTYPDTLEMIVGEKLNLTIDFTNVIGATDTISNPLITVTNAASNETVPTAIIGSPSIAGKVLSVTLSAADFRPSTDYVVSFTCTVSGVDLTTISLLVLVVF